jgi:putative peptidoglycan lipid II flippase
MAVETAQNLQCGRREVAAAGSVNQRILRAALTIAGVSCLVKVATTVKDMVVAASFGTGDTIDAFLIAFSVPTFLINVLAGSFNAALIPTYIQVREREGRAAAQRLFSGTVAFSSALLVLATILLAGFGPYLLPLLGSGFSPEKRDLTLRLFYLLLPTIAISGLATNWGSVLNAGERFGLAAVAPIMVPVVSTVSLLVAGAAGGIDALAWGTVAGFLLQAAVLGWSLRRQELRLLPRWHGNDAAMMQVIHQYLPMLAGGILMNSTRLVDQAMASMLAPGSVAVLGYGNRVVGLVVGLTTSALGTAVLPYLTRMVAAADWAGLRHTLRSYTKLILATTIPLTVLLYLVAGPLVRIVFQRGAFTGEDTHLVAGVQAMYTLQIPFYTLSILFVRLISALRANQILMWGTAISAVVNIVLDYVLMRVMGIAGIALATTAVYCISLCFLGTMSCRLLKDRR